MKRFLNNQSGMITIITLMVLSVLFVIMMGSAGLKLFEASRKATQMNEAYNYLLVMEELGQAVSRARSLGRDRADCWQTVPPTPAPGCPAGTVARTRNNSTTLCAWDPPTSVAQYTMCIPNHDGDGVAEAGDFCVDIGGFNYCLTESGGPFVGLERYDLADGAAGAWLYPAAYVEVGGGSTQLTPGGVDLPRNNQETWSPTTVGWGAINNEIYTTRCGVATPIPAAIKPQYWLGCHWCEDPRVECWRLRMCRPSTTGVPVACAATEMAHQSIYLYFENDRRD